MGNFKKICVFCGSNSGNRKIFSDAALDLGRELVERKIDLVYGGGSIGLMGLVSQAVFDGGCNVIGIIPRALVSVEISGHAVGEVLIVSDMHERKAEMATRADAFVALPGKNPNLVGQIGHHISQKMTFTRLHGGAIRAPGQLSKRCQNDTLCPAPSYKFYDLYYSFFCLLSLLQDYVPTHNQVAPSRSWNTDEPVTRSS
ncbi:probable cytokinin riboside 5'-monophosphate phosphoribohydrolase LOGL1 [Capsicum annuum]|uniref:probable cytokinin riboside 5'-monophosphate phosphoribohydrolase LOGL1 n=1 Tax=Capsicum annuum TaxID=4072 RepID=UPI001FB0ABFC|nr:probable cytokinin riboside 5'-monophosphate phosphoribohydrolase LOGL1 [Capsicum annuum]